MPLWSGILAELSQSAAQGSPPDFDGVRRRYLADLYRHTDRDVVLYASGWLQRDDAPPARTSITDEDIHALMEVTSGLRGPNLDLILHSPGGSPEAAAGIVAYLRSRFSHIRVIVPQLAMSAAVKIVENHAGRAFIKHHLVAPPAQAVQIALDPNPPAG